MCGSEREAASEATAEQQAARAELEAQQAEEYMEYAAGLENWGREAAAAKAEAQGRGARHKESPW